MGLLGRDGVKQLGPDLELAAALAGRLPDLAVAHELLHLRGLGALLGLWWGVAVGENQLKILDSPLRRGGTST